MMNGPPVRAAKPGARPGPLGRRAPSFLGEAASPAICYHPGIAKSGASRAVKTHRADMEEARHDIPKGTFR
jgi:hypothetical protein